MITSKVPWIKARRGFEIPLALIVVGTLFFLMLKSNHPSLTSSHHSLTTLILQNKHEKAQNNEEQYCHNRKFSVEEHLHNPMEYDDPRLIQHIRERILIPPSTENYKLKKEDEEHYTSHGVEDFFGAMFGKKKGRIFIDAGAGDGEEGSTTLILEKERNWSGLLIEADSVSIERLKQKHRKSWIAPVCLSPAQFLSYLNFIELEKAHFRSHLPMKNIEPKNVYLCPAHNNSEAKNVVINMPDSVARANNCRLPQKTVIKKTCYPLMSLLLATNFTTVDLLSINLMGAELHVMSSLPFNSINIKAVLVAADVFPSPETIIGFMKIKGFSRLRRLGKYLLSEELPEHFLFLHENYESFPLP